MILVGNPEPQLDKIFTNLEFRACVEGDGVVQPNRFTPVLPFTSLETWNEYQHGETTLSNKWGHAAFIHHSGSDSSLKRRFRIWECDIPRDNYRLPPGGDIDPKKGISRYYRKPNDRMRNPWIYIKLWKDSQETMPKSEIHDIKMSYFT